MGWSRRTAFAAVLTGFLIASACRPNASSGTATDHVTSAAPATAVPCLGATSYTFTREAFVRVLVEEHLEFLPISNVARIESAVGALTGTLAILGDGTVAACSKLRVDLDQLHSVDTEIGPRGGDRDGCIGKTLQTEVFPFAEYVPRLVRGTASVAGSEVEVLGDLSLHGKTKEVLLVGSLSLVGSAVNGTLSTKIRWDEFGMTAPRLGPVLTVADVLTLEIHVVAGKT